MCFARPGVICVNIVQALENANLGRDIVLDSNPYEDYADIVFLLDSNQTEAWFVYTTTDGLYDWNPEIGNWEYRQ